MTAVALPGLNKFLRSVELSGTVDREATSLRVIRQRAISENNTYVAVLGAPDNILWWDDDDNDGVKDGTEKNGGERTDPELDDGGERPGQHVRVRHASLLPQRERERVGHAHFLQCGRLPAIAFGDPADRHGDGAMKTRRMRKQRTSPRHGSGAGFSLIEVMFALTFLAVGILAVASMIPAGTRGVSESRTITSSLMAAQLKIEELKGTTYSSLAPGTGADTVSTFQRSWTVTDSIPTAGCKRIVVTSNWTNSHGGQSTTLTSYVTR